MNSPSAPFARSLRWCSWRGHRPRRGVRPRGPGRRSPGGCWRSSSPPSAAAACWPCWVLAARGRAVAVAAARAHHRARHHRRAHQPPDWRDGASAPGAAAGAAAGARVEALPVAGPDLPAPGSSPRRRPRPPSSRSRPLAGRSSRCATPWIRPLLAVGRAVARQHRRRSHRAGGGRRAAPGAGPATRCARSSPTSAPRFSRRSSRSCGVLAKDGVLLRRFSWATSTCPRSTGPGLEGLLAEELATEKMSYTLELKEKQVKENALEARRREAAAREGRRGRRARSRLSPPRRGRRR